MDGEECGFMGVRDTDVGSFDVCCHPRMVKGDLWTLEYDCEGCKYYIHTDLVILIEEEKSELLEELGESRTNVHCDAIGCRFNKAQNCQAAYINLLVSHKVSRAWGKAGELAPLDCCQFRQKRPKKSKGLKFNVVGKG